MTLSPPVDDPAAVPLSLRFTEREPPDGPPDLAAFSTVDAALLLEQLAGHDDSSPLADLIAAGVLATRARIHVDCGPDREHAPVFLAERTTPIPAIDEAPAATPKDFALGKPLAGHLVWIPRVARRPAAAARAALVLAVSIPLSVPDVASAQSPPARPTAIKPTAAAPAAPTPPPAQVPAPPPAATTAPPAEPPSAVEPPPETPAIPPPGPPLPPNLPPLQAILDGMRGHEAVVFARGATITGLIVSVEGDFVAIVDSERDGKIAMVPKTAIVEVRGRVKKPPPVGMPDGTAALAGGGVLVAIGSPLMLSGLVFLGITPSYPFIYLPQIIPAAALLGAGIPLLLRGTRQRRAYRAAMAGSLLARGRVAPSFAPTRGGWTGGLTFRF